VVLNLICGCHAAAFIGSFIKKAPVHPAANGDLLGELEHV
jgi:hypothetical protein